MSRWLCGLGYVTGAVQTLANQYKASAEASEAELKVLRDMMKSHAGGKAGAELSELRQQAGEAEAQLTDAHKELVTSQETVASLAAEIAQLQSNGAARSGELTSASRQLSELKARLTSSEAAQATSNVEVAALRDEIAMAQSATANIRALLKDAEATSGNLERLYNAERSVLLWRYGHGVWGFGLLSCLCPARLQLVALELTSWRCVLYTRSQLKASRVCQFSCPDLWEHPSAVQAPAAAPRAGRHVHRHPDQLDRGYGFHRGGRGATTLRVRHSVLARGCSD